MKILVDADACPVKDIIVKLAREFSIDVTMFIDTSHELNDGYSEIVVVDKGADSVDIALANKAKEGDIVVTQDYGLAAITLAKKAHTLNQDGMIFTNFNIDRLLFQRHMGKKIRNSGGKTTNPKKRTKEDSEKFEKSLRSIIVNITGI